MYYLGLDIGTTGCKSMLFDEKLNIISRDYIEYDLIYSDNGIVEQSPAQLWEMTKRTIRTILSDSKVPPDEIKAMGISAQGISFVPIDKDGKELCNIISWLDTRAQAQTDEIKKLLGEDYIFQTTGKRINASYTLPKIIWLKENDPDIYQNTYKFLMVLDYITYKLTGEIRTDYSMASGAMMFDISNHKWDEKILNTCGIDRNKLPEVAKMGITIGRTQGNVASELGLTDTTIVLGAQDQKCAALGAGIEEGVATVSLGTSTAISILCEEPVLDGLQRIPCFALDKKSFVLEAVISTSGAAFKWLRNLFETGYDDMCELAEQSPAGSKGVFFYPHFTGAASPYWKGEAKGSFYGITLNTDKSDIIRSLLEGIAFQIKINIDAAKEITGTKIEEIRLFGGGAKQALWAQMIADVTGKRVRVPFTSETASLGAALLACGKTFTSHRRPPRDEYEPDEELSGRYEEIYDDYLAMQAKMLDI